MMANYEALIRETSDKLRKALEHLQYSFDKVQHLPDDLTQMDDEVMETWESFSSRFSRVSDIFIKQYIRTRIAIEEPGYKGTTRDYLNKAEKLGLVSDATLWVAIRELRNVEAHEYNDEDLTGFYRQLKVLTPELLAIKNILADE